MCLPKGSGGGPQIKFELDVPSTFLSINQSAYNTLGLEMNCQSECDQVANPYKLCLYFE